MNNNYNRGNTYVEIVIALFIFAMIFSMSVKVFQFSKTESRSAAKLLTLPYTAQAYIEELIAAPMDTFGANSLPIRKEYGGYFFEHYITTYWNGNVDVLYYVIRQVGESYSIDVYGSGKEDSHTIINAMKYELEDEISIEELGVSASENIIIYCTSENLNKINIDEMSNVIIILDNSSRKKIIFKLSIDIFQTAEDITPILSMETLIEKEI